MCQQPCDVRAFASGFFIRRTLEDSCTLIERFMLRIETAEFYPLLFADIFIFIYIVLISYR